MVARCGPHSINPGGVHGIIETRGPHKYNPGGVHGIIETRGPHKYKRCSWYNREMGTA